MKLELTNEQYKQLMELVWCGNYVFDAVRQMREEDNDAYNEVESIVFKNGLTLEEDCAVFDEDYEGYLPTEDYANDKGLKEMIADFEDMSFWELLAYRLAQRDVEKKVKGLSNEIAYNAISERIDEYSDEFFENDVKNVYVKGMNALKGDLKGIRSMIAGDLPSVDNDDY